jgi:putative MATE family efflux protein
MNQKRELNRENKMGYMPCGKLLISMSLPMMISMLVQALYNIVDSIFVARISENALTAVSLAFPVQMLIISVIGGTGVGINARLSAKLGERNFEEVNYTAGNALTINLIYAFLIVITGRFISGFYYHMMTPDAEIRQHGYDYLMVITTLAPALVFQITLERLLQSTGKTFYSMISQTVGAITNIIMDPILIFGLCGLPAMGTKGAALATVFGQSLACLIGIYCNLKKNPEITFGAKYLKPHRVTIERIYAVGIPSIIMQSIGSVMNLGMNKILLSFTSTSASVFGVYYKLQSFVFMPVFGLNNGLVPIIAFNYGARRPDRIRETMKYGAIYAASIMLLGMLLFELFPDPLLDLFNASEHMKEIGRPALRIIAAHFILASGSIICISTFQALGHGVLSMWVSIIRQLAVLLPSAFLLSRLIGLDGVWMAFPIAELVAISMCLFFVKKHVSPQLEALNFDETGSL